MIFLDLPTEVLCRILSYLPALDLCAAQLTCCQINRIITDTVYFQYILRTYINSVDDLFPPDCPLHERIELLKQYEKSWNNLQLNKSAEFPINVEAPNTDWFTLQDGYLVYKAFNGGIPRRYGYLDLSSVIGNKEASWVHIPMEDSDLPMHDRDITFAADHDLVISVSTPWVDGGYISPQIVLAFFEFTTGAPHPLSTTHTIYLPLILPVRNPSIEIEVLGDHILVSVQYCLNRRCVFLYLVSWKTGAVTHLRVCRDKTTLRSAHRLSLIDPDDNIVALIHGNKNCIEICKLEIVSPGPRLQTLCFLKLPPLESNALCLISAVEKEWVRTSQNNSQPSRGRLIPFRSSRIATLFFSLKYGMFNSTRGYGMIVSIAALLSAARSSNGDVITIPWTRWGPPATHIFPLRENGHLGYSLARPAGPFWIMENMPLVIRDYNLLRKWRMHSTTENPSSLSGLTVAPTKVIGQHWVGGEVETHLPYHDVVAIGDRHRLMSCSDAVVDREWLVGVWREWDTTYLIVHHIG